MLMRATALLLACHVLLLCLADWPTDGRNHSRAGKAPAPLPGGGIPPTLGWYQIPNTQMAPVCPTTLSGCQNVIAAWSGGIADIKRNRLIFWGGGHSDYAGNEVYALDLNALKMLRLNNPSIPFGFNTETNPDGLPSSRHTYGGLSYVPSADKMFAHGGGLYGDGSATSVATWTFDPGSLAWTPKDPTNDYQIVRECCNYQSFTAYDPGTDAVYMVEDGLQFTKYVSSTNSYTLLQNVSGMNCCVTAVVDEGRHLFLVFGAGDAGGQVWQADISPGLAPTLIEISSRVTGCGAIQNASYPGLAYDPVQKLIVGWVGGDTVYLYNPGTKSCTTKTFPGGPGAAQPNGTFGRFRYFPALNVFAVVNGWKQNAFTLRLTSGGGPPAP